MSAKIISDNIPFGTYVAKVAKGTDAGKYLADEHQNYLSVTCHRNDKKKVAALIEACRHYGYPHVVLEFREGARQVSDDEYQQQRERLAAGLIPDPWDIGNAMDDLRDGTL